MSKSILISIRPEFISKILNKEKTIEIRKSKPSCELPCKVYIYCTQAKPYLYRLDDDDNFELINNLRPQEDCFVKDYNALNGKVVGEFVLNKVKEYGYVYSPAMLMQGYYTKNGKELEYSKTCLKLHEIEKYADDGKMLPKPIYAWHIDNLKIYDKPKELSEFKTFGKCKEKDCINCQKYYVSRNFCPSMVKRPPQSYMFVQELEE